MVGSRHAALVAGALHHRGLVRLCGEVAGDDASPYPMTFCTDALVPAQRGYPATSLIALDESDYPPNYHWRTDTPDAIDPATLETARAFTLRLLRRVDEAGLPDQAGRATERRCSRDRSAGWPGRPR